MGIVLDLTAIRFCNLDFTVKTSDYGDAINLDNENLKISKVSGKIFISGNLGWGVAKVAEICTGSGTSSDPYVIEDLVIDGGGSGSCIQIENSNVYFRIENCTLFDSGSTPDHSGILLKQTSNGQLINNNCSFNRFGINFDSNCEDITIQGNIINNNKEYGINLMVSSYNEIKENTVNYNGNMGINLEPESSYNEIVDNTVNFNGWLGIHLQDNSAHNLILSNNCSYNNEAISVRAPNNTISENYIEYNSGSGIHLWKADSYDNTQSNNITKNFINSNNEGIILSSKSSYNNVSGNIIVSNSESGISLDGSNNNIISGNIANNNAKGIQLLNSDDNEISENRAKDNEYGIYLEQSNNNMISKNNLKGNDNCIEEINCEGNTFKNNKCKKERIPGYNLYILLGILPIVAIVLSKKVKKS